MRALSAVSESMWPGEEGSGRGKAGLVMKMEKKGGFLAGQQERGSKTESSCGSEALPWVWTSAVQKDFL